MDTIRSARSQIVRSFARGFLPRTPLLITNTQFRKWFFMPMNYWRSLELPLVYAMIGRSEREPLRILDVSSPKLLAFVLARRFPGAKVTSTDISDYFVADATGLRDATKRNNLEFQIQDARALTFGDGHFDLIYSISTIEHIPDEGDIDAIQELHRVLAPGGRLLVTVPFASTAIDEFIEPEDIYWSGFSTAAGQKVFYQRRYDRDTIKTRIAEAAPWEETRILYMAERPVDGVRQSAPDGMMEENIHTISARFKSNLLMRTILKLQVPVLFAGYWYFRRYSDRCHYLTDDASDTNIRGAFVEMVKPG